MAECERCKKVFPSPWRLVRHLGRQTPCVEVKSESVQIPQNNTSVPQNNTSVPQKHTLYRCLYCCKPFNRADNRTRHEVKCNEKRDSVRQLEIKLKKPDFEYNSTCCRFCGTSFTQTGSLTRHLTICKEKERYRKELENELEEKTKVKTQHTTVINNITNNVVISKLDVKILMQDSVSFTRTDMSVLTAEKCEKLLRYDPDEFPHKGIFTVWMNKQLPQNHNVTNTNLRGNMFKVKIGASIIDKLNKVQYDEMKRLLLDEAKEVIENAQCFGMVAKSGFDRMYNREIEKEEDYLSNDDKAIRRNNFIKTSRDLYSFDKKLRTKYIRELPKEIED